MEEETMEKKPRRNRTRKPKGTADGTRTSVNPSDGGGSTGTAAHDNPVDTRQSGFLLRPNSPMLEMDGRKYSGYGDASPRVDLPLMVVIPTTFNIKGYRPSAWKADADAPVASPEEEIPGLARVSTIANNLYEEVVYMGEARDGFKQLPAQLHNEEFLIRYIQRYMLIVSKLVMMISLQQLATYDIVARRIGLVSSTLARAKLKTAIETITSLPMYPVFHNLAVLMGTPIIPGTPTGPIVVRTFPYSPADQWDFGDDDATSGLIPNLHNIVKGVGSSDNATTLMDVYGKLHDSSWWSNEYADILRLIQATQRVGIKGGTGTDMVRDDMLALQGLLRILKVPVNYMTYGDVKPSVANPTLVDTVLNYGAYVGQQDRTGKNDLRIMGPDASWNNGMVEMRYPGGIGLPHILGFFGTVFTKGGYHDIDELTDGGWQFGIVGEATDAGSTPPKWQEFKNHCQLMLRRIYREDAGVTDVWSKVDEDAQESDEFKNYPLAQHWWRDVATAGSADPEIHRDKSSDSVIFIPEEDFGWHYLKWFTTAIGVPTRL